MLALRASPDIPLQMIGEADCIDRQGAAMSVARGQFQKKREHGEKDRISERKDELIRYVRHDLDLIRLNGDLGKENFLRSLDGAISWHVPNSQGGEVKDRQRTSQNEDGVAGHPHPLQHRIGAVSDVVQRSSVVIANTDGVIKL